MSSRARSNYPRANRAVPTGAVREAETEIRQAELPTWQQAVRGRRFIHLYLGALLAAGVLFVVLAVLAHGKTTLLRYDVPIMQAVQSVHMPLYNWVLTQASDFGFPPLNMVSYVVVFALFFAVGLRAEAVLVVASSLLAGSVGGLIKQLVGRLRPATRAIHVFAHLGGFSFPSGHVIQYTTLFGFSFYLVFVVWRTGWLRALVLILLGLLVVLVGPSRVYLGEHWPSDVIGGYLFAGVWLAGTIELHLFLTQNKHIGAASGPTAWQARRRHSGIAVKGQRGRHR
jgi:membrane-associated phospholipid phosphatase